VIPNAVRMPEEEPGPQRVAPVIGTLARLSRQKGLDVLLDAMALLVRERPDARLSIAGGGPLEVELRMHARRLGLDGHVRFEGWVPDGRALLADWDVFVLPSRWEGMPLALLEARAAGLPSVATDVGGAREIIRDGEDGWVVPTEDPASLAAALLDLADDPARRAEWGARARRRAAGEHGLDEMVRRTELHYLEQVVFAERHA
jgi:glycosyltransferase involved in cell wall biosynthesis